MPASFCVRLEQLPYIAHADIFLIHYIPYAILHSILNIDSKAHNPTKFSENSTKFTEMFLLTRKVKFVTITP